MKVVYITDGRPKLKKLTKKQDLKQTADLLASQLRNSISSKRTIEMIRKIELAG